MKKFFLLFGLPLVFLTACGRNLTPIDITVEAGSEVPGNIENYAEVPDGVEVGDYKLDISKVDPCTIGEYEVLITDTKTEKTYPVKVTVADTVYPEADLTESYTISQPTTLAACDYVTNIKDVTETEVCFLTFEKRGELQYMSDEELEADAKSGSEELPYTEDMSLVETADASEDGIYDAKIAVKDAAGNLKVFEYTFYVDGTAPEATMEDQIITINNAEGEFEIDWTQFEVSDNFNVGELDDNQIKIDYESTGYTYDEDGNYVEDFLFTVDVSDLAGNTQIVTFNVTTINEYNYLDAYAIANGLPTWDEILDMVEEFDDSEAQSSSESSSSSGDAEKDAQARAVAQSIADQCTEGTDLERVQKAAQIVCSYCANGTYGTSDPDYKTAYGVFCKGVYTCAGSTRAMGLVLECMGFSWTHVNPNQWTHQWCELTMDGQAGWVDGMGGIAGYGVCPWRTGTTYTAPDGTVYSIQS